ncbi:MAG TPA: TonB-dependent siderophore receptor [Candidatus Binatia bacterium]|jgi:catecholate siderophore receptor
MSRQEKRANERRRNRLFHKIALSAGEGVGRAVAFTFALATNGFAAEPQVSEPKKEEEFALPPVTVTEQKSPYVVPNLGLQRLPEPVQDIPQSITIVPRQIMEEQQATTLRDALRNVSGIGIAAGEGGGAQGDNFTLRGFSARNDMYLDGIRDQGTYFRDTFNIQNVEVLKGPASIYFGRGSTGGIINQVSKLPQLEGGYDGTFSAGSGALFRGTADINQPLSPTIALRLNAMAHRADIVARNHVEVSRQGVAPTLSLGLGTPTQMNFSYFFQHEDNIPDYGFPFFHGKPVRVDRDTWYGLTKDDYEQTHTNIGTVTLNHQFSDALSLNGAFRYSNVNRDLDVSIPQTQCAPANCSGANAIITGINRSRPERHTTESIMDSQVNLTARFDTFGFKHTLSSGIETSWDRFDNLRYASAGPATTLNNPNNNQTPNAKTLNANAFTNAMDFGVFGADQIALHEYFDIIGGVRWDYFSADQNNKLPGQIDFSSLDKMFSYRGGVVFHPTPQQSYYFSYATAFNPSAEGLTLNANNESTPPEKNEIFEIGSKFLLMGGALTLQGALFTIEKTNARTNDPILGVQVIDGKQRSRGVEFSVAGRVLPGWNVFAGYTFLDAKILKSNDTQTVEGVTYSLQGKVPQNIPKYSATLWTTYDFLDKWQIGGGPTYVGSRYANNANVNQVPGYVRWDATIAYNVTERIQCRLNAQNFTNSAFIESVHPSHVVPGAGRTFIASTSFRF